MVRSVFADESIEQHVEQLFKKKTNIEVGLLVGRWTVASRDLILSLVPQPPKEDGTADINIASSSSQAPKKSGGKKAASAVQLTLDSDWLAEHALQVSRMLIGGINVVGVYVFSPDDVFKASTAATWQVLSAVHHSLAAASRSPPSSDLLLLHICSGPKRFAAKICSMEGVATAAAMKPCELKFGKIFGSMQTFCTVYDVNLSEPVCRSASSLKVSSLRTAVATALAHEEDRLSASAATDDVGSLVSDEDSVVVSPVEGSTANPLLPSGIKSLQLFCPPQHASADAAAAVSSTSNPSAADASPSDLAAMVCLRGEIFGLSSAFTREPMGRVVADLKADIIQSIRVRLDLLVDEAEQREEEAAEWGEGGTAEERGEAMDGASSQADANGGDKDALKQKQRTVHPLLASSQNAGMVSNSSIQLPSRVIAPWKEGLFLADYLLPGDSKLDAAMRCQETISWEVDEGSVVVVEGFGEPLTSQEDGMPWANEPAKTTDRELIAEEVVVGRKERSMVPTIFIYGALIAALISFILALVTAYMGA